MNQKWLSPIARGLQPEAYKPLNEPGGISRTDKLPCLELIILAYSNRGIAARLSGWGSVT